MHDSIECLRARKHVTLPKDGRGRRGLSRSATGEQEPAQRISDMPSAPGRLEKRIHLAVPVQIVSMGKPGAERATTEDVSSQGVRVLVRRLFQRDERLLLIPPAGAQRTHVRVIYCERLPNGLFATGLQFLGKVVNWSTVLSEAE
jgi:hypothetical protein